MKLTRRWRITLGGLMLVIALIALGLAWLRGRGTRVIDVWWGSGPAVKARDTVLTTLLAENTTWFEPGVGGSPGLGEPAT